MDISPNWNIWPFADGEVRLFLFFFLSDGCFGYPMESYDNNVIYKVVIKIEEL